MNAIFSEERVNTGRQLELDLVKAAAIILMIWTHTYETLSTGFEPSLSAVNAYVTGSIACATTFMFCMGMGIFIYRAQFGKGLSSKGSQASYHWFYFVIVPRNHSRVAEQLDLQSPGRSGVSGLWSMYRYSSVRRPRFPACRLPQETENWEWWDVAHFHRLECDGHVA